MDHRCLYGHRVPGDFRFAIERNACPVCGAELVSLDGYKLARALVKEAQLDAVTAFKTAKVLEQRFEIRPREPGAGGDDADEAPTRGEVQLDQEDLSEPAAASPAPRIPAPRRPTQPPHAQPSESLLDELEDAESVELIATDDTDESRANGRMDAAGSTPDSGGFDAVEESFFSSSP